MAIIPKITNIISGITHKITPSNNAIQEYASSPKKQLLGFNAMDNFAQPDFVEISADYSQELVEDMEEKNNQNPSLNLIA